MKTKSTIIKTLLLLVLLYNLKIIQKEETVMKRLLKILLLIIFIAGVQEITFAEETFIVIHVRANDAKFIGDSMGNALIIIRNAQTGEILDEGMTRGDEGDTNLLMRTPLNRGMRLTNENTAELRTILYIDVPTLITVEAHAPGNMDNPIVASTQLWVIPGKHILGDGIILTIPGFAVRSLSPQPGQTFKLSKQKNIPLKAHIVTMCGCPVTPNGLWDANGYEIKAIIRKDNETVKTVKMVYAGEKSTFSALSPIEEPGTYEVYLYAYDPKTGNTGVDKTSFTVTQ